MVRASQVRPSGVAFAIAAVLLAGLAGLAPAFLSLTGTLALGGIAALLLVGVLTHRLLIGGAPAVVGPRIHPGGTLEDAVAEQSTQQYPGGDSDRGTRESIMLRAGRVLFLLGTVTVTQSEWRLAFGLTLSEALFIASFTLCCLAAIRGHAIAPVPAALVAGVLMFSFGAAVSSLAADSSVEAWTEIAKAIYVMLLWAWTAAMVLRDRRAILTALTLWVASASLNGVGSVLEVAGLLEGPGASGRATGFTAHSNDLGGAAAVALIPALMLAVKFTNRNRLVLFGRVLAAALVATGLVLSGSVAALLAALVALIVWLSAPKVSGVGRVAVAGVVALGFVAVSFLADETVPSPVERVEQVIAVPGSGPEAGSGTARVETTEVVWPRIAADPFIGEGIAPENLNVQILIGTTGQISQIHGAPLSAWYGAGIFGLVGILLIFAALGHAGWAASSSIGSDEEMLIGWALVASLTAFFIFALSAPLYFQQYGWIAAAITVAWWSLLTRRGVTSIRTT